MKTHAGGNSKNFGSAIFIIRDPRDAMISNWNRIRGRKNVLNEHVRSAGTEHFCKSCSYLIIIGSSR